MQVDGYAGYNRLTKNGSGLKLAYCWAHARRKLVEITQTGPRHGRLLFARLRHDVMQIGLNQASWAEDLAMIGPRDVLLAIALKPRPRILRPILEYAMTTRVNTIMLTDQMSVLWAQKYAKLVLPCHVASHSLGPSYTAISSAVRLLAVAYVERIGDAAAERLDLIAQIHEELDDAE